MKAARPFNIPKMPLHLKKALKTRKLLNRRFAKVAALQPETSYPLITTVDGSNIRHDGTNAIFFKAGVAIDGDGGPHCYHPAPGKGLDFLANAGSPGNWWGIATDPNGRPYVQKSSDPAPGFYVSTTSLQDPTKKVNDCARYANSEAIAYVSLPPQLFEDHDGTSIVQIGDVGIAFFNGIAVNFIVADVGGKGWIGEASIYFATRFKLPDCSPKTGGMDTKAVGYCILPQSRVVGKDLKTGILIPTQNGIDARVNEIVQGRNIIPANYFAA